MSNWIPLMDYAIKKSVSISTLRRYIKSNRIKYRTENGKYMLWDDEAKSNSTQSTGSSVYSLAPDPEFFDDKVHGDLYSDQHSESRIKQLEESLRKAQEEIAELKMLVSVYETLPNAQIENFI